MKTTRFMNRLMVGSLLFVAGIVASCGETGVGSSGILLSTSVCPGDANAVVPAPDPDPHAIIITAGDEYGRAVVVATKPAGIQRTKFGNDTILDSTDAIQNIPAAGAAIYITQVAASGTGFSSTSSLAVAPIGGIAESLPTVFFADDQGRLDVDIFFNLSGVLGKGDYPFNVTFQSAEGSEAVNCEFTITVTEAS